MSKYIKFILLIFWMGVIFSFSNDPASISSKKSDGLIINTIEFIKGRELTSVEKDYYVEHLVYYVRKSAHMGVYFILGILIMLNLNIYIKIPNKLVLYSLVFCFIYACSDEFHQLFVPGRSGEFVDVVIDSIGSMIGIGIYYLIYFRKVKKNG